MVSSSYLRLSLLLSRLGMLLSGLGILSLFFSYLHYALFIFGLPFLYFLVAHSLIGWMIKHPSFKVKSLVLAYLLLSGVGFPDNPLLLFVSPLLVLHLLDLLRDITRWPKA